MKRRASNPWRVILSGIIDFAFFAVGLFLVAMLFRRITWNIELGEVYYPIGVFVATGFVNGYIFILLPILDHKGGSFGKRMLRLRCVNRQNLKAVSFGHCFLKSLLYGLPVLVGFAVSYQWIPVSDSDMKMTVDIVDVVIPAIFFIQAISLFFGKRSLFEKVSGSVVVNSKLVAETEIFSSRRKNYIHKSFSFYEIRIVECWFILAAGIAGQL